MKKLGTKILETKRLLLRKLTKEDAIEAYNNWCSKENVAKYVLFEKHNNVEVTKKLFENWEKEYEELDTYRWIVQIKDTKELIGTIDVSKKFLKYGTGEIGYCYGDKFWGLGYGTESLSAVIKYLFEEVELELIYANHMINNPASGKVMEKSGMKYEGKLRSRVIDKDGNRNDLISYSITKDEYYDLLKKSPE